MFHCSKSRLYYNEDHDPQKTPDEHVFAQMDVGSVESPVVVPTVASNKLPFSSCQCKLVR